MKNERKCEIWHLIKLIWRQLWWLWRVSTFDFTLWRNILFFQSIFIFEYHVRFKTTIRKCSTMESLLNVVGKQRANRLWLREIHWNSMGRTQSNVKTDDGYHRQCHIYLFGLFSYKVDRDYVHGECSMYDTQVLGITNRLAHLAHVWFWFDVNFLNIWMFTICIRFVCVSRFLFSVLLVEWLFALKSREQASESKRERQRASNSALVSYGFPLDTFPNQTIKYV